MDSANNKALAYMEEHPHRWTMVKNYHGSFMWSDNPQINQLMIDIDRYSGNIHSGASIALTMQYLHRVACSQQADK